MDDEKRFEAMMSRIYAAIIKSPLIGYDPEFWRYCIENPREEIINLCQYERHRSKAVRMKCEKDHQYMLTPYEFFVKKRYCPYCKCGGDKGAAYLDDTLFAYWADERFDLDDISEYSTEKYRFVCPFCAEVFYARMIDMVNRRPKCVKCKDYIDVTAVERVDTFAENFPFLL